MTSPQHRKVDEIRGINGCLQCVTNELLYPFQFVVTMLRRRQRHARVRDLLKANEVIDEVKQHEDISLTFRVLDFTSCGLIGVSDVSLSGVDRFSRPTDQDSKTVKVHSQAGVGIVIGEKPLVSLGGRGKFNMLECDSRTITLVCRPSTATETRGLGLQVDSMQFYADLLNGILGESAPYRKSLHLRQNAIEWPTTIVTDARDVYDKVSTEKRRAPATEGSDTGKRQHSRMVGHFRLLDTLDRRGKQDHEQSDERSQGVKTASGSSNFKWRVDCTTRRHVG